jgi:hypothetical protein
MAQLLFIIALNALGNERLAKPHGEAAPAGSGAKPAYCAEATATSKKSECRENTRSKWERADATAFTKNCPQPCDSLKVISRADWNHPQPTPKLCTAAEKKLQLEYAVLKQQERVAYCGEGDAAKAAKIVEAMKVKGREPPCMIDMDISPKSLNIHHSEGQSVDHNGKPVGAMNMFKYYTESPQTWSDIPYHFVVAKDEKGKWQVFEGRKRLDKCKWVVGGHVGPGANLDSLGILIVGNYNTEKENPGATQLLGPNPPEPGAMARVVQLVASLKRDCPTITNVMGHGEARARAYGCVTNGKVDLSKGNCKEENKGVAGRAGCWKTCPGVGCSAIPGDLHNRVVNGR